MLYVCSGCYKCDQQLVATLKFTPEELRINPYSCTEVLHFKSIDGQTVYFPKGVRQTECREIHKYDYETAKLDYHGCQGDYYITDYNWMVKTDSLSNSRFDINLSFRFTLDKPTSDMGFDLYFWIKVPESLCFWGFYNFTSDSILNYYNNYSNLDYKDSIVTFHPTFELGPTIFYNIYELYCHNPDHRDTTWISTAYYSIKDGLVGFKTNFGKTWYLEK
jgi:hypothetical protein